MTMNSLPAYILLLLAPCLFLAAGCSLKNSATGTGTKRDSLSDPLPAWARNMLTRLPADSTQALLVLGAEPTEIRAVIYPFRRRGSEWSVVSPPIEANAGRSGFARPGEKREGDGKTPSGIYPLEFVFGHKARINTKMAYRQATIDDIWVDDPASQDYNRWMKRWETKAASFEEMKRSDDLYRMGIVVGYNTNPVKKGLGSAIFLHIRKGRNVPTEGCISMDENALASIIAWLDAAQKPHIIMGTESTLKTIIHP